MQRFLSKLKELIRSRVKDGDLSEDDFNTAVRQASGHAGGTAKAEAMKALQSGGLDGQPTGAKEFAYSKREDLPDQIKTTLPEGAQKVWMAVFNTTFKDTKNEGRSSAMAWGAVKRAGWHKNENDQWVKATESDSAAHPNPTPAAVIQAAEESHMSAFSTRLLSQVYLSEDGTTGEVQIFPAVGKYKHPRWGEIDVSPEFLAAVKANFDKKVYQQELPLTIDLEHQSALSGAAGWVKNLDIRGKDGMWATIEFNDRGQRLVAEDAYRYFSPEFYDKWTDPGTNTKHENLLIGGALTNRPFFKGMSPVAVIAGETLFFAEAPADFPEQTSLAEHEGMDEMMALMKDVMEKMSDMKEGMTPAMRQRMDDMMNNMGSMMGMMTADMARGMGEDVKAQDAQDEDDDMMGMMSGMMAKMRDMMKGMPKEKMPEAQGIMDDMTSLSASMQKEHGKGMGGGGHKRAAEGPRKTEDGEEYPAEAYLYTPEADKPSTWKLPIWENLKDKVTKKALGRASAAFSPGGFRGNKVELPTEDKPKVLAKLRAAYSKLGVKPEDLPAYIRASLTEAGLSEAEASAALVELDLAGTETGGNGMGMSDEEARQFAELQTGVKTLTERLTLAEEAQKAAEEGRRAAEAEAKSAAERVSTLERSAVRKQLSEFVGTNRLAFQGEVEQAVDKLENLKGKLTAEEFQEHLDEKEAWHAQMSQSILLTPQGRQGSGVVGPAAEFESAVRKVMSEQPTLKRDEAVQKVADENPVLYTRFDRAHKQRAKAGGD